MSTVYLHVGAPKTGTTYLQSVLWKNRRLLREDGILYPGEHHLFHTHAALNLREIHGEFAGYRNPAVPGAWRRLAAEARDWDGTVLVSQELFSPAEPAHIERALESLDFADVHIIYTARDLARQVPAAWQEDLKNRKTLTFAEFLENLQAPPERMHRLARIFWRMQDAADVLGRWSQGVPPERVHLITLPWRSPGGGAAPEATGEDPLWTRFCEVTGLDPDRYDTASAATNSSLGISEANLLRRLNLALTDEVSWPLYSDCVTGLVSIDVLGARPNPRKITLSDEAAAWLTKRAHSMVEELRAAKYHVLGDLDDLLPANQPNPAGSAGSASEAETGVRAVDAPGPAPAGEMVDAAVESMAALITRLQGWRDELDLVTSEARRLGAERDRLQEEVEGHRAMLAKPPLKLFVVKLSEKHRAVLRARIVYWNIVGYGRKIIRRLSPGRAHGR
jgi:hypothetical protein